MKKYLLLLVILILSNTNSKAQQIYFPPLSGSVWDTTGPQQLGWCTDSLQALYNLLEATNTKAFIILKNGKIVIEKYYDTFTKDSIWYWASAGKTLTAFSIGQAQEQGYLDINDTTSKYLGSGWTSCTSQQEANITIRNQLTMTTGLDDGVTNSDCTNDSCLQYLADAGFRWAYHNGPYTLLQNVLDSATGNFTTFFNAQLKNRIGMNGLWLPNAIYNSVYFSNARSMARYGLLLLNKGIWNNDTLLHDTTFIHDMTNTSQNLNLSYGYLTWLNGKSTYMVPQSQFVFNGSAIPYGPDDMFMALGKNDQKIHVVPSLGLVVIRMGNNAYQSSLVPITLDNEIWKKLNFIICDNTSTNNIQLKKDDINIYPNPTSSDITVQYKNMKEGDIVKISDLIGKEILKINIHSNNSQSIILNQLDASIYFLEIIRDGKIIGVKKINIQ